MSGFPDSNSNPSVPTLVLNKPDSPIQGFHKKNSETTPKKTPKQNDFTDSSSNSSDSQDSSEDNKKHARHFSVAPKKPDQLVSPNGYRRPIRSSMVPSGQAIDPAILRASKTGDKNLLATPDFLKEYRYRRRSSRSIIKENNNGESRELHQMAKLPFMKKATRSSISSQGGLSPSIKSQFNIKKSLNDNKLMIDQKQISESQVLI